MFSLCNAFRGLRLCLFSIHVDCQGDSMGGFSREVVIDSRVWTNCANPAKVEGTRKPRFVVELVAVRLFYSLSPFSLLGPSSRGKSPFSVCALTRCPISACGSRRRDCSSRVTECLVALARVETNSLAHLLSISEKDLHSVRRSRYHRCINRIFDLVLCIQ